MPTLIFTWKAWLDARTCNVCKALDGYKWYFREGEFPLHLAHPAFGVVWDLVTDQPKSHGYMSRRGAWNCRCTLTWEINDDDLQEDLNKLRLKTRLIDSRLEASLTLIESFISLLGGFA